MSKLTPNTAPVVSTLQKVRHKFVKNAPTSLVNNNSNKKALVLHLAFQLFS